MTIYCDDHESWPAIIYATSSYGDKLRALCCLCEARIMEYPHYKDITVWNIKTLKKYVKWGTNREREVLC